MPRISRGCEECKKRRIGCDGKAPSCGQCLSSGRECSGPMQGLIVIDQTRRVVSRNRRARPIVDNSGGGSIIIGSSSSHEPSRAVASRAAGAAVRLAPQPSPQAIDSVAFIGEFLAFVSDTRQKASKESWLVGIHRGSFARSGGGPGTVTGTAPGVSPLDLAVQAVSLVYCGATAKNPAAVREACRMYGAALARFSSMLSARESARSSSSSSSSTTVMTTSMSSVSEAALVCTSVILSIFEAICPSNPQAYATHLTASWKMLASMHQGITTDPLLMGVFTHVHFQTLFVMVAYPSIYLGSAYSARRCNAMSRAIYDDLPDTSARYLVELFDLADTYAVWCCSPADYVPCDADLNSRMHGLWAEYQLEAQLSADRLEWSADGELYFHKPHTAFVVAYFAAGRILLSLMGQPLPPLSEPVMQDPFEAILRCAAFLAPLEIGCACLRMFFPVTIVARSAKLVHQRQAAYSYLVNWLRDASFSGLSVAAVQCLRPS